VRCVEGESASQYVSTTFVRFCASVLSTLYTCAIYHGSCSLYCMSSRYLFSVCIVFWLLLPYSIIQSFFDCPSSFQYFICVVLSSLMMTVSVFYLYISFVFELPKRWFSLLVSILILS